MVFFMNVEGASGKKYTYAVQEDTFALIGNKLLLTGLRYEFDDGELDDFIKALDGDKVNFELKDPSKLMKICPSTPYFPDYEPKGT